MKHVLPPQPCKNFARCQRMLTGRKIVWCNGQCRQQWRAQQKKEVSK